MALREVLADLQIKIRGADELRRTNAGITGAVGNLQRLGGVIRGATAALGAGLVVRRVVQFTGEVINLGDEIDKTSQALGLSAEALQRWRFVAERSGVSSEQLSTAFLTIQRNAGAAAMGTGEAVSAFRTLGVQLSESNGELRSGDALFRDTIDALGGLENATQRSAIASRIFGESGARLLPIVNSGAQGIAELNAQFDALGGGLSDEAVAASAAAADALTNFELRVTSLKGRLAASLLPTLTRITDAIGRFSETLADLIENTSLLQAGIAALTVAGIELAAAFAPVIASFLASAAAALLNAAPFIILFLLVEDLITLFRGGESVIGDFVDALFGVGSAAGFVEDTRLAVEGLVLALRRAQQILDPTRALVSEDDLATASGRAENLTQEQIAQRQRRSAALSGRVVGTEGQSFEEASAVANAIRAQEGLAPIGADVVGAAAQGARGGGRAPATRSSTTNVEQTVTSGDTVINVTGSGDPQRVAQEVERRITRRNRREIANAAQALLPQGA